MIYAYCTSNILQPSFNPLRLSVQNNYVVPQQSYSLFSSLMLKANLGHWAQFLKHMVCCVMSEVHVDFERVFNPSYIGMFFSRRHIGGGAESAPSF